MTRVPFLGGAERVLLSCMRIGRSRGFDCLLACPDGGELERTARREGFEVQNFPFSRMKSTVNPLSLAGYAASVIRGGRRIERVCRDQGVALIHAHGPVAALYGVQAARALAIPMLVHIHDALRPSRGYRAVLRYAQTASPRFLAVSRSSERMLMSMGVPGSSIRVLYNSVDAVFLAQDGARVDLGGPGPHIGLFALIWPLKGQHVFLEAAARIALRNPGARFHVVGSLAYASDQKYLDALLRRAHQPPLAGRVSFTGFRHDVRDLMAAMDVVALCSVEPEALPTVMMEAMALGKKVVGTAIGGTVEVIEDGVTGRLVPPNDPEALANAIEELAALPADHPMCLRAAASVRERFSPERFNEDMGAIYDEVLQQHFDRAGSWA